MESLLKERRDAETYYNVAIHFFDLYKLNLYWMSFDVKMVIFCPLLNGYFRNLLERLPNFGCE